MTRSHRPFSIGPVSGPEQRVRDERVDGIVRDTLEQNLGLLTSDTDLAQQIADGHEILSRNDVLNGLRRAAATGNLGFSYGPTSDSANLRPPVIAIYSIPDSERPHAA